MEAVNDNAATKVAKVVHTFFTATCALGHDYRAINADTVSCRWCGDIQEAEQEGERLRYFSPIRHIKGWFEPKSEDIPF